MDETRSDQLARTSAVATHGYTPESEPELIALLQAAFGPAWGEREFWRWKHLHRPGFRNEDVRLYTNGGGVIGCWHMAARLLRLGPGIEIAASVEGDYAMHPHWRGVGMGRDAASLREVQALAGRGIIARFAFTMPRQYERIYRPKLGYRRIPAATRGYRKLVSASAVRDRLQRAAEHLRSRALLRSVLRAGPLVIGIEVSGFPRCVLVLDAAGTRCLHGTPAQPDLALRLPYALLNARTFAAAATGASRALLEGRLRARHLGRFIRRIAAATRR